MSLSELWPQLATLRANESNGSSMAWKVLYSRRRQPLLVPLDIAQARSAIAFFMRNPLLRYWGNLLLTLDHWMPRAQLLPTVRLEHFPYTALFETSDFSGAALFFGFPGPLQKLTMYCPDGNGGLGKVAKVALHTSANHSITQEAHWLRKLNQSKLIAGFLPSLLHQGALPCGRHYISMLALPQGSSTEQFSKLHYQFLTVLAQQKTSIGRWQDSDAYARLHARTMKILPLIDEYHRKLLQNALAEVDQMIGLTDLPTCMMHGDFAPWNVRLTKEQLFVFDWEYAETSANPLQDFLHFYLIPRALQRLPMRASSMSELLPKVVAYAHAQFGKESGVAEASGALIACYLLDVVTFYVDASGYLDPTHPVLRTYLRLLEQRTRWLPPTSRAPVTISPGLQHCG